jgi:hypothetical protein
VRFWDSSAIVPTLIDEPASADMRALLRADPDLAVWWATQVECLAAVARRERSGELAPPEVSTALAALGSLDASWVECPPIESVRDAARRIARIHDVRTADAFQIAAADALSDGQPEGLPFVTLDERLAVAARREGFPVLP